jgi:hypothetical protein
MQCSEFENKSGSGNNEENGGRRLRENIFLVLEPSFIGGGWEWVELL